MRTPDHTPGPWDEGYRDAFGRYVIGTREKPIAVTDNDADACLIRAAPEMLDALQWQEMAEADPAAARRKGYFDRARELRRAALGKATGHAKADGSARAGII